MWFGRVHFRPSGVVLAGWVQKVERANNPVLRTLIGVHCHKVELLEFMSLSRSQRKQMRNIFFQQFSFMNVQECSCRRNKTPFFPLKPWIQNGHSPYWPRSWSPPRLAWIWSHTSALPGGTTVIYRCPARQRYRDSPLIIQWDNPKAHCYQE